MHGQAQPAKMRLSEIRERAIEGLSVAFAEDELSLEEFESRIDGAFAAQTEADLGALVADLGRNALARWAGDGLVSDSVGTPMPGLPSEVRGIVPGATSQSPKLLTVFGNTERSVLGEPARRSQITCVFGNVEIDLRDAVFVSGVTEIELEAICGNIEITIPPHLSVVCEGTGIFGSFAGTNRVPINGPSGGRQLRIRGRAIFGNVEVHTRPSGTSRRGLPLLPRGST